MSRRRLSTRSGSPFWPTVGRAISAQVAILRAVTLYVCWNVKRGPLGHPCGNAYHALRQAGHDPEVIKSYGLRLLPDGFNGTEGRREAKRLTGSKTVPVLVTDEGEVVSDSKRIVVWAREHPAGGESSATATAAT